MLRQLSKKLRTVHEHSNEADARSMERCNGLVGVRPSPSHSAYCDRIDARSMQRCNGSVGVGPSPSHSAYCDRMVPIEVVCTLYSAVSSLRWLGLPLRMYRCRVDLVVGSAFEVRYLSFSFITDTVHTVQRSTVRHLHL